MTRSYPTVTLGSKVKLKLNEEKKIIEVTANEKIDPGQGKISPDSPVGQALLGRKTGDKFRLNILKDKNIEIFIEDVN